jgi:hypothetical protein
MGLMTVVCFVVAALVGILLALRFKVFVVVPATLLAVAVIIAISHQTKLATALTAVGTAALLQIGYVVGVLVRALPQRMSKTHSKSIGRSSPWQWDRRV